MGTPVGDSGFALKFAAEIAGQFAGSGSVNATEETIVKLLKDVHQATFEILQNAERADIEE